jgi:hypothetical protein
VKIAFIKNALKNVSYVMRVVEDISVDDASISKEARLSAYAIESAGTRVGADECCVVDVNN